MRLLMLTSSYPLAAGDWRGAFVRDLALTLTRHGIDVEVAIPRPPDETWVPPEPAEGEPRATWLPVVLPARTAAFHGSGLESNLARRPLAALSLPPFLLAFALEASLRAAFADCLMAHWLLPMGLVGAALARAGRKPLVVVAHSAPPAAARIPPLREAVRFVGREASAIACVSESVRAATARVLGPGLGDRARTLPLGVELRPHARLPASPRPLRLLFVGRLVTLKGADLLLRAVERVPGVELTVIGDGPEAPALRDRAAGLSREVRFLGERPQVEVLREMRSHDVLVVPSRRGLLGREEGMPRVVVEAWSCGLPVIGSALGGVPEAMSRGGGILVEPGSVDGLAGAIESVRSDAALMGRLRREAAAAAEPWSWEVLGPRWAALVTSSTRSGP
jgi:glycosyltransferase involved in cell wall biosynthesis